MQNKWSYTTDVKATVGDGGLWRGRPLATRPSRPFLLGTERVWNLLVVGRTGAVEAAKAFSQFDCFPVSPASRWLAQKESTKRYQ